MQNAKVSFKTFKCLSNEINCILLLLLFSINPGDKQGINLAYGPQQDLFKFNK